MDKESRKDFVITGVYGPTKKEEKDVFWEHLNRHCQRYQQPWIVIGDLNELYCHGDKKGGNRVTFSRMRRLNEFFLAHKLENIPFNGSQYMWEKRHENMMIFEKLDRGSANESWLKSFPESYYKVGNFTCSDHAYIELNT